MADLHFVTSDLCTAFLTQLDSTFNQLSLMVEREKAFCVIASPAPAHGSLSRRNGSVSLSFEEEEAILVDRASVRGENVQPIIIERIRDQIAQGLWRESTERLRTFDKHIRAGTIEARVQELFDGLNKFAEDSKQYASWLQYLLGFADRPDGAKSERLQRNWSEEVVTALAEHALFILTSFEQLSPLDFNLLMQGLLRGKTIVEHVQETEWVAVDETSEPQGNLRTVSRTLRERSRTVPRTAELEPAYAKCPDHLLALLDIRADETGYLAFEPAFKQQVARHIFRSQKPVQAETLFLGEAIERSMIFDVPVHIAEQLADRYAGYAARLSTRKRDFITDWMDRSARHFIEERIPNFKISEEDEVSELKLFLEAIAEHVSRDVARDLSRAYAERASLLLTRLLSNHATKELVDQALDHLMVQGQDATGKHDLILMFVRILRQNKDFDTLRWLKRLLSEGDDDTKRNALNLLAGNIERGTDAERMSLFEALTSWMPSAETSILNNQTAALLAPRLVLHRAFARRRDREHGTVDQLPPLFDLGHDDGLAPEFASAIRLITTSTGGAWLEVDLGLLVQLAESRWDVDDTDSNAPLSSIAFIDPAFAADTWTDETIYDASLVAILVESAANLLGNPDTADPPRLTRLSRALTTLAGNLPKDRLYLVYRKAYDIWTGLTAQSSQQAQRRASCALWLGDVLYRAYAPQARNG